MKRYIFIILALLMFSTCFGQNENILEVSTNEQIISQQGGMFFINVTCNTDWTVTGYEEYSWLSAGPGPGHMWLDVTENMDTVERHATLTLSAEGVASKTVEIIQAWDYILYVSPLQADCIAAGDTFNISVVCNTAWVVYTEADWVEISQTEGNGDDSLQIINLPHTDEVRRHASIVFTTMYGNERVLTIMQEAYSDTGTLSLNRDTLIYSHNGGSKTVLVASNTVWRATCTQDWFSLSRYYGRGTVYTDVIAQPNESETDDRMGEIIFSAEGAEDRRIVVIQKANSSINDHFIVAEDSLFFDKSGGFMEVNVSTNFHYTTSCPDEWVRIVGIGVPGTNTRIICTSNYSYERRYSVVTFEVEGYEPHYVYITQDCFVPSYINTSVNNMNFPAIGGTQELYIESNVDWEVNCSERWLTLNTETGSNNFTLLVTAEAYNRIAPRSALITIEQTSLGVTQARKIVSVLQDPVTTSLSFNVVEDISICPNPANDRILVANAEGKKIEIINTLGQVVISILNASNNQTIDIDNLVNGTYYVKVGEQVEKINVVK